jgi:hypothetical protein
MNGGLLDPTNRNSIPVIKGDSSIFQRFYSANESAVILTVF